MKANAVLKENSKLSSVVNNLSTKKSNEFESEFDNSRLNVYSDFSFSQQPVFNYTTGFPLGIQPKLMINEPGDKYEQEADAMAEKIMRMEIPNVQTKSLPISVIQRKCAHCEEEEKKKLQRKEISSIQRQHTGTEDPPVRKGEVSDVVDAVTQIPFVSNFLTRIGDDFKLHLENTWNASLPNKVGIIGGGLSLSAGLGLAVYAARNNPKALDLMMSPLSGTVIAPFNSEKFPSLVRSFAFEVNFDSDEGHKVRNIMGGVHFDVGRVLPTGSGFGPVQEWKAFGPPWETPVHRKTTAAEKTKAVNTNQLDGYVGNLPGGGKPLSTELRSFYEPRFGYDFSKVRIHDDAAAAKSANSINALAYTHGNNIVFNSGQYSPQTNTGKRLLSHELTHVVQQGDSVANQIQLSPGSPAGGCGVCYGLPMLAGRVAHSFIQEAFQFFYPQMLTEHHILSILPVAANFSSGFLDLAILESVDQIAIGEIKPANADGLAAGTTKLALYKTALEALGMHVRMLDYEPPPITMEFPTFGRGPSCPRIQALEVLPADNGVYTYTCEPDYSFIRSSCDCREQRKRRRDPVTEKVRERVQIPSAERDRTREVGTAVAGTAATIGAGYIVYRGLRMLPSLFPPLWGTIPANLAIP